MMPRDRPFLLALALWTLLCALFGVREFVDLDAVQLLLALEHQDLRLHQPQPPGFVLHVWPAQVLHAFGLPPFLALRFVSWLVLTAAATFLFRLGVRLHGTETARWAAILFLSSPLVLFQGMSVGTFGDEALVASITAFLCVRACMRPARGLRFEAYVVALLAGLRPTTLVFSLPLLLWTGRRLGLTGGSATAAGSAWFLGMLCWLIPQAELAGGFDEYVAANRALLIPLLQANPLSRGPLPFLESLGTPITALLLGLGAARLLASLIAAPSATAGFEKGFVLAWTLPVVFLGLLLGFRETGALLALWPLLCIALASGWTSTPQRRRWAQAIGLAALALDVAGFFWITTPSTGLERAGTSMASGTLDPGRNDAPAESAGNPPGPRPGAARPAPSRLGWTRLLARVDFFHDRARQAPFDAFLSTLEGLPFPEDETLLLGTAKARAACVRLPARPIVQADPLRPFPFLLYRELRPTNLDSTFVVPSQVAWLLVEGEAGQLVIAPGTTETQRPVRPIALRPDLQAFPIGRQRLEAWFTPRTSGKSDTPGRLHLWREGLLDDPTLYERASTGP